MALLNNQMVYEIYPYDDIPNMMGRKKRNMFQTTNQIK